ncbi:MAG: transketolase [Magnetococcales bacterium]|nr:transketolase [Magnetococcales bacterium]
MRKSSLDAVFQLAQQDERVIFLGSDLGVGTLQAFRDTFPERFFMEGIAEQNLIGMAAGLAMEGFIPYVNTIASFLTRRCLEQITIDVCLHHLPVRLIGNGGGLVYAPLGPTHLATDDLALMRAQPHMTVLAPCDALQMRACMAQTLHHPGPIYIRLAKGGDRVVFPETMPVTLGQGITLRPGDQALLITTGVMAQRALEAALILEQHHISCGVAHLHTVKPLDDTLICNAARTFPLLVTLEEHSLVGGLGSAVAERLADQGPYPGPRLLRLGLPDCFPHHYGSQEAHLAALGLDAESIARRVALALDTGIGSQP